MRGLLHDRRGSAGEGERPFPEFKRVWSAPFINAKLMVNKAMGIYFVRS
jgi:hypothetical protein